MRISFHNNAVKFLEKCPAKDKEKIRVKLFELLNYYRGTDLSGFHELHIKNLEGQWQGFRRMRIGKIRIIFRVDKAKEEILIYEIDYRGDVYK